jgi:hypothetical protein
LPGFVFLPPVPWSKMNRALPIVACSAFAAFVLPAGGCGGSGPPRAAIHGRVTIADQPLAGGQIVFIPISPTTGPTVSAAIVNGEYKLDRRKGPVVGLNRVEVRGDRPLGFPVDDEQAFAQRGGAPLPPDPVPATYNTNSQLSFDVKSGEDNVYNVPIPAQPHLAGQAAY